VLAFAGCGGSDDSSTGSTATTTEAAALTEKPKVEVPSGPPPKQLEIKELQPGGGAPVENGDYVTVQYVGVNYKSGTEFDASWNRGEPFPFTVGGNEVIPGWEKGLLGMRPGGRRELIIPPDLAYGETGSPPLIPPNETLVFVIDLFEVGTPPGSTG
jgi:peptidylprolyl isomerase